MAIRYDRIGVVCAFILVRSVACGMPPSSTTADEQKTIDASIQGFISSLYAPYAAVFAGGFSSRTYPSLASLGPSATEEEPETIYDAETSALVRRDQATTPQGEGRVLDFDPICDCQDFDAVKVDYTRMHQSDKSTASIAVSIIIDNDKTNEKTLTYELTNTAGVWRIHDIKGKSGSLRQILLDGLAKKPTIALKSLPPMSMRECEKDVCGIWTFEVDHGEGAWLNGATASLSSELLADGSVTIRRRDTISYLGRKALPQLTAVYSGKIIDGKIEKPTVTWTRNGHDYSGTWSADIDKTTIQEARQRAEEAAAQHNQFRALRWSSAGAVLDDAAAQFKCAQAYLNGDGLPKNAQRAATYLQEANAQGDLQARLLLAAFYRTGTGLKGNGAQADYLDMMAGPKGEAILAQLRAAQARADASDAAFFKGVFGVLKSINQNMVDRQNYCKTHVGECRSDAMKQEQEDELRAQQEHDSEVREYNYEQTHRP